MSRRDIPGGETLHQAAGDVEDFDVEPGVDGQPQLNPSLGAERVGRVLPVHGMFLGWDGTNANGDRVAASTYFYRVRANGEETARKMMMLNR